MRVVFLTLVVLAGLLLVPLSANSASAAPGPARTLERPAIPDPFDHTGRALPDAPATRTGDAPHSDEAMDGDGDGSGPVQHDDGAHEPEPYPTTPEPAPGDHLAGSEPADESDPNRDHALHVDDGGLVLDRDGLPTASAPAPAPAPAAPWPRAQLDALHQWLGDLFAAR